MVQNKSARIRRSRASGRSAACVPYMCSAAGSTICAVLRVPPCGKYGRRRACIQLVDGGACNRWGFVGLLDQLLERWYVHLSRTACGAPAEDEVQHEVIPGDKAGGFPFRGESTSISVGLLPAAAVPRPPRQSPGLHARSPTDAYRSPFPGRLSLRGGIQCVNRCCVVARPRASGCGGRSVQAPDDALLGKPSAR